MTSLALLLVLPLVWPFVAKMIWKHEITLAELGLNLLIGVLIVVSGWALGRYAQALDVEILNGQVTGKRSERVPCEHSYSCNCRESCTGSGSSRSCSTTCSTCYEHAYDWDWLLETTVKTLKIDRVDRRGTKEPARFSAAQIGDPVAVAEPYQNYIKAAPDSLFNAAQNASLLAEFGPRLPEYPSRVYDYHYVDRVLTDGVALPQQSQWSRQLAERLRSLGPQMQVNLVVVMTSSEDPRYADALNAKWLGGKKNDVVVVLGTPNYPAIGWVRVLSWTEREVFKVQLRDALLDLKEVELEPVLDTIAEQVQQGFKRRPMADFEYLKDEVEPPLWLTGLLLLLSAIASVGAAIYFANNEHRARGRRFGAYSHRQPYSSRPTAASSRGSFGTRGWLARLTRLGRFGGRVRRR